METTQDLYKTILDNNDKLYLFFEKYHQIINKIYKTEVLSEKNQILYDLNEIFIKETPIFKLEFLAYVHKMAKVHNHFEDSWKDYEKQIQDQYLLNFFGGVESNQTAEWLSKTSDELLAEATKDIVKPEEYDVYKSIDGFLRIYNFRFILSLKDCLPPEITLNSFHQIFEIFNSYKKGYLKQNLEDIVSFYKRNRFDSHTISSLDVYVFLNKLENSAVENEICLYLLGKNEDTVTLAEPIGLHINTFIESMLNKKDWVNLFKVFHSESHKTQPSKKWFVEIKERINVIGIESYSDFVVSTLEIFYSRLTQFHNQNINETLLENTNQSIIRGIFFSIHNLNNSKINKLVFDCSVLCLKKVKNIGALLVKVGNSGILGFAYLPYEIGKDLLSISKTTIKYPLVSVKTVENSISQLAKFSGKSPQEIEDSGMPSFGFAKDNIYEVQIGELVFYSKENSDFKLKSYWKDANGVSIKKLPEDFKIEYSNEIKDELKHIKEAQIALNNYKNRIEYFYTQNRRWNYSEWEFNFLENGFIGIISKKLIWFFEENGKTALGIFKDSHWIDSDGNHIFWISNSTNIELWHPLGFDLAIISQWRLILEKWQIKQPFKQVYREVYLLTDAEIETSNFSNRFSSNILLNYQFGALLKIRNWRDYNQYHDGGNPKLILKEYKINAIFGVEFLDNADRWGTLAITDRISFYNSAGPMELQKVPAIVFSEVMRDIDLFVSVCCVGNDPNWVASRVNMGLDFNSGYVFGDLLESAKIRKAILKSIIPKLKIAGKLELNGNFLIVKGELRTYKVHIGSSNILMEPTNQYLCIVPNSSPKINTLGNNIHLPFEDDFILSLIISKAVLLAEDFKITDSQIINQIKSSPK